MAGSPPFRLNDVDIQKLGNSAMLAVSGIAVGLLMVIQERASEADSSSLMAVLVTSLAPVLINLVRKFASDTRGPLLPSVAVEELQTADEEAAASAVEELAQRLAPAVAQLVASRINPPSSPRGDTASGAK